MSTVLEAVFTADWHLGRLKKYFPNNHLDLQFAELVKPFDHAIENGISHVFVPGDISDTPFMEEEILIRLLSLLMRYDEHLTTYYLAGNHDYASAKKTSLDFLAVMAAMGLFKNLQIIMEPERHEIDGVPVAFLPFPDCVQSFGQALGITHIDYPGALNDNGRRIGADQAKTRIQRVDGDFVVSGHVHKHQYLESSRFMYIGAPYQTKFGEELPKGFVAAEVGVDDLGIDFGYQFINTRPAFTLARYFVECDDDLDGITDDPAIAYSLRVSDGIAVPKELTTDFPNIIEIKGKSRDISLAEDIDQMDIDGDHEALRIDPTLGLHEFLKERGFSKRDIAFAVAEVEKAKAATSAKSIA